MRELWDRMDWQQVFRSMFWGCLMGLALDIGIVRGVILGCAITGATAMPGARL